MVGKCDNHTKRRNGKKKIKKNFVRDKRGGNIFLINFRFWREGGKYFLIIFLGRMTLKPFKLIINFFQKTF